MHFLKSLARLNPFGRNRRRQLMARGYAQLSAIGGQMSDWIMSGITEDADIRNNIVRLRNRSRDLFKENPYVRKFRSDLLTNVLGFAGVSIQMKVKEEADRVIHTPGEKAFLKSRQRDRDAKEQFLKNAGVKIRHRELWDERKATVVAGQPDVYANNLIERAYARWKKRQFCTAGKRHTYQQASEQMLTMAARDGDLFIHLLRGFPNEFGFAIRLIASEYCDHELNKILPNGNEIKMGIEYDRFGAPVKYYFIKRKAGDWQNGVNGYAGGMEYEEIDARDIIHYSQFEDSDTGRGVPWIAAAIPQLRHINKYEESEVVAARAEACKGGHYEPQIGGLDALELADNYDKTKGELTEEVEPGMWKPLPYGWTAKSHDPTHPNGDYPDFRKTVLRGVAAALPAESYNSLGSDLSEINYSSYKAGRIDVNEVYKALQQFHIDTAEIPIFEAFLEMALASGAIPLPLAKIDKFNAPRFQGRRWEGLEPLKEASANEKNLALLLTSRTRITEERGEDFEEILEEAAFEKVLIEQAGFTMPENNTVDPADMEADEEPKPVNGNGKAHPRLQLQ